MLYHVFSIKSVIDMIESICCTLLVLIARITAGVYQSKFTFLSKILVPLNIAIIVLAIKLSKLEFV